MTFEIFYINMRMKLKFEVKEKVKVHNCIQSVSIQTLCLIVLFVKPEIRCHKIHFILV